MTVFEQAQFELAQRYWIVELRSLIGLSVDRANLIDFLPTGGNQTIGEQLVNPKGNSV
jgi:hypothetical protein